MSIISEGIRVENNGELSFGNYEVEKKVKINDFDHEGNKYTLRSYNEMTRLQKNGGLLLETVPGSTVHFLNVMDTIVSFKIEGNGSTQVTLELEPNTKYRIFIDDVTVDANTISNTSGKISFSLPLTDKNQEIKIEKI